ncbi:polysaccharide deacetylase family protein [Micromonospora sp. 4G57]|uniref:Polysaccharide deacetylase family protein n=1 Tax=Micromonospora sicca TaxID=2202420 RepID=A0ABU5J6X3_9ACTN|nr:MULTISPECIES: polysaccharide deacetylase family protein [unclassified Micromonospora]MDZ5443009.1 polysaccharide deacetylase family protein [Micromonospora sp. 4G57]MDZ5488279.1 polysaccharide deacetylase family protein [Micromonospora sp. 4G53]
MNRAPKTVVPVLCYHSVGDVRRDGTLRWAVSPGDFDEQMALIRERGRTPMTASGYAAVLRGLAPLPPRPVLITFDDGFPDLAEVALPVLRRHGLMATAYVIAARVGVAPPSDGDPSLDWDQLRELHSHGVEIGSHSRSHRALDCLRPSELHQEVVGSRQVLEDGTGTSVRSLAYPYGYHSIAVRTAVRAAGYSSACGVKNALSHPDDDVFAIARVLIERKTGVAGITALLDGTGWPLAWRGERWRTRGWRAYRRARHLLARRAPATEPADLVTAGRKHRGREGEVTR